MNLLWQRLSAPKHLEDSACHFASALGVKITNSSIHDALLAHPNYPSLLSVANTLKLFNVETLAAKVSIRLFPEIPTPFLAHIKSATLSHDLFGVVLELTPSSIRFYNPEEKKTITVATSDFEKTYKGSVLMAEGNSDSGEKDFVNKQRKETRAKVFKNIIAGLVVSIILLHLFFIALSSNISRFPFLIIIILCIVGFCLALPLIYHEIDKNNQNLKQFCKTTVSVNCDAVLGSKGSKIFGLSWSVIGASYFAGIVVFSMANGVSEQTMSVVACLNIAACPYVLFSLFYQWRIAKQWCIVCLYIQGVLLSQLFLATSFHLLETEKFLEVPSQTFLSLATCFLLVFGAIYCIKTLLTKDEANKRTAIQLRKLKYDPATFEGILTRQKHVEIPPTLGITLGKANAKIKLTKVCNPYCNPCALAHFKILEAMKFNDDVSLQIIFTASESEDDPRSKPVKHFLDVYLTNDFEQTEKILSDWYADPKKDFDFWSRGSVAMFDEPVKLSAMKAMREWCDKTKIIGTPTFFVNGYEMPSAYSVDDFKYLFCQTLF